MPRRRSPPTRAHEPLARQKALELASLGDTLNAMTSGSMPAREAERNFLLSVGTS